MRCLVTALGVYLLIVTISSDKIDPKLKSKLDAGEQINVLVSFEGGVGDACKLEPPAEAARSAAGRGQFLNTIKSNLEEKMLTSQDGVLSKLVTRSAGSASHFAQFWITNQLIVGQADATLIQQISEDPQVAYIMEVPRIELFDDYDSESTTEEPIKPDPNDEPQPNLKRTDVPEAWAELGGNKGEGIVIGFMDTGVHLTHETLNHNFLGEYGWYDPTDKKPEPTDATGHGTHVAAFAVGSKGIGVAPGAKWSACRICRDAYPPCTLEDILHCAQFFTCPTLTDGTYQDCSKAPHIINNSWGGKMDGSPYFDGMLDCWKAAGIIPIFAIGNYGVDCNTVQYPGTHPEQIGVGFMDETMNNTQRGCSRGPTDDGRIKPDIMAPGTWHMSADYTGDSAYRKDRSGSSFASPHVAGAVALLLTKNNQLDLPKVKELLLSTVEKFIATGPDATPCGDIPLDTFPNNLAGHGLVNVLKLVRIAPEPGQEK